jgi:hypothetical protein
MSPGCPVATIGRPLETGGKDCRATCNSAAEGRRLLTSASVVPFQVLPAMSVSLETNCVKFTARVPPMERSGRCRSRLSEIRSPDAWIALESVQVFRRRRIVRNGWIM